MGEFDTTALQGASPVFVAFAAANGMSYAASGEMPGFAGSMFDYIQSGQVTDRFSTLDGRMDAGTVTGMPGGSQTRTSGTMTVTVSNSSTEVRSYGYLALRLERALPQFVLDATSNNSVLGSNLPMTIARGQRLSLEGDFDKHFALHAPQGYETDALYVFTPDLMALLIDETNTFDVEIVDDWLFVYANQPFDFRDPAVWARIARIRDVVWAKALSQTDMYRDDRSGEPHRVSEQGRRLRQGFGMNLGGGGKTRGRAPLYFALGGAFLGMLVAIGGAVVAILFATGAIGT